MQYKKIDMHTIVVNTGHSKRTQESSSSVEVLENLSIFTFWS